MNTVHRGTREPVNIRAPKFTVAEVKAEAVKSLIDEGYHHCLYLGLIWGNDSPTVGTEDDYYRIMGFWLFFKKEFPLDDLQKNVRGEIPVLLGRKYYLQGMMSRGSNVIRGSFSVRQLKRFMEFFDRIPVRWSKTCDEEFEPVKFAWK